MADVEAFFKLTSSDAAREHKFAVLFGGYKPIKSKSQTIARTGRGGLDVSVGNVYERHVYQVRVRREDEDRDGYGLLSDLDYFYTLNDPNGTPSNIITLTDHFGNTHQVIMTDDFAPEQLGVMLIGQSSWLVVQCVFEFMPEVP